MSESNNLSTWLDEMGESYPLLNAVVVATKDGGFTLALSIGSFDSALEAEYCADVIMGALASAERDAMPGRYIEH